MSWFRDLIGGVADPVGDVFEAKERTEQLRIEAEYRREAGQLDAQSKAIRRAMTANGLAGLWYPILMMALTALVVWFYAQTFVVFGVYFFRWISGSRLLIDASTQDLIGEWVAIGTGLTFLIGAFGGVTHWRQTRLKELGVSEENVSDKRSLLERIRREPPTSPVVESRIDERGPITERLDGVVVPPRSRPEQPAQTSGFVFGARSRAVLATARVELRRVHERALELSEIDFACYESRRTREQQVENIANGVSWTMDSRHLEDPAGAVDHVPIVDGKACWEWWAFEKTTAALKAAAAELGVACTHGIDWNPPKKDGPHTELDRDVYPMAPPPA